MSFTTPQFFVYWIQSSGRSYIGATVNPARRLRQHNGEIAGGAARTRGRGPWHFECVLHGFRTWKEALQYEWAAKYYSRKCRGVTARREALLALNCRERWTSNSPPAREVDLTVQHTPGEYGGPPAEYGLVPRRAAAVPRRAARGAASTSTRTRKFTKTLHKVVY